MLLIVDTSVGTCEKTMAKVKINELAQHVMLTFYMEQNLTLFLTRRPSYLEIFFGKNMASTTKG
jgi:hypothetical protein